MPGFALVVTISLLALLVLVCIALLTLSGSALRGVSLDNAQAEARANARLSLMLALAELQKQLGPDQRISACANVLDGNLDTAKPDRVENPHWLGAWTSWQGENRFLVDKHDEEDLIPDHSPHREDSFRRWLVSAPHKAGEEDPAAQLDHAAAQGYRDLPHAIRLVGPGSLGPESADHAVDVPLVSIAGRPASSAGRLGWWVGDENQKALVAPGRSSADLEDPLVALAEMDAASTVAAEVIEGMPDPLEREDLARAVTSRRSLDLLPGDPQLRPRFHDLTPVASSLLVDVREGGFKRDFSLLAERETVDSLPRTPENQLYSFGDEEDVPLHDLLAWFSLCKESRPGGGPILQAGGTERPHLDLVSRTEFTSDLDRAYTNLYRQLVPVKIQLVVALRSEREAAPPPGRRDRKYRLRIRFNPVVTLWNPYNVPIVLDPSSRHQFLLKSLPVDMAFFRAGGSHQESTSLSALASGGRDDDARGDKRTLVTGLLQPEDPVIAPGEVRVFSLERRVLYDLFDPIRNTAMKEGYHPRAGNEFHFYHHAISRHGPNWNRDNENYRFDFGEVIEVGFSGHYSDNHLVLEDGQAFAVNFEPERMRPDGYSNFAAYSRRANRRFGVPHDFNRRMFELGNQLQGIWRADGYNVGVDGWHVNRYRIAELNTEEGIEIGVFSYGLTGENEVLGETERGLPIFPARPFLHSLPTFGAPWIHTLTPGALYNLGWRWKATNGEETSNEITVSGPHGRWGGGWDAAHGQREVVQFEIPQRPVHSLAAFTHAMLGGWSVAANSPRATGGGLLPNERIAAHGQGGLLPHVSHAIGNSYAHPNLAPDRAFTTEWPVQYYSRVIRRKPFADHSYLANHALWDEFFLSSLHRQEGGLLEYGDDEGHSAEDLARELFSLQGTPLPNSRLVARPGSRWETVRSDLFQEDGSVRDNAEYLVARHLLLRGGFNVNSTSVEAWKAVLGSLRERPLVALPSGLGYQPVLHREDATTPLPSVTPGLDPASPIVAAGDVARSAPFFPEQWSGSLALTDDDLTRLAGEVVKQVKLRGPFLSLSDFVNRRLSTDPALALHGALQAAIEAAGLNEPFHLGRSGPMGRNFAFPEAAEGPVAQGSNAYLDQADLLRGIDASLVVRGDTFVIRAYGDSRSSDGVIKARAYCEAVVQRDTGWVHPGNPPEAAFEDLLEVNQRFGRRFRVLSFRWLADQEI